MLIKNIYNILIRYRKNIEIKNKNIEKEEKRFYLTIETAEFGIDADNFINEQESQLLEIKYWFKCINHNINNDEVFLAKFKNLDNKEKLSTIVEYINTYGIRLYRNNNKIKNMPIFEYDKKNDKYKYIAGKDSTSDICIIDFINKKVIGIDVSSDLTGAIDKSSFYEHKIYIQDINIAFNNIYEDNLTNLDDISTIERFKYKLLREYNKIKSTEKQITEEDLASQNDKYFFVQKNNKSCEHEDFDKIYLKYLYNLYITDMNNECSLEHILNFFTTINSTIDFTLSKDYKKIDDIVNKYIINGKIANLENITNFTEGAVKEIITLYFQYKIKRIDIDYAEQQFYILRNYEKFKKLTLEVQNIVKFIFKEISTDKIEINEKDKLKVKREKLEAENLKLKIYDAFSNNLLQNKKYAEAMDFSNLQTPAEKDAFIIKYESKKGVKNKI